MICGLVYGWDREDTPLFMRSPENMENTIPWVPHRSGGVSEEEAKQMGENSDEDWDKYSDDDFYYIRECQDSDEEVLQWRYNSFHGTCKEREPLPDYEFIPERGWVPKNRPKRKRAETGTERSNLTSKSKPESTPTETAAVTTVNNASPNCIPEEPESEAAQTVAPRLFPTRTVGSPNPEPDAHAAGAAHEGPQSGKAETNNKLGPVIRKVRNIFGKKCAVRDDLGSGDDGGIFGVGTPNTKRASRRCNIKKRLSEKLDGCLIM